MLGLMPIWTEVAWIKVTIFTAAAKMMRMAVLVSVECVGIGGEGGSSSVG